MIGAIAGDILGSVHEGWNNKATDLPLFRSHCRSTDDTVLTVAVMESYAVVPLRLVQYSPDRFNPVTNRLRAQGVSLLKLIMELT
jgi:hypothetical protein